VLLVLMAVGCQREEVAKAEKGPSGPQGLPPCIQAKIDEIVAEKVSNPPVRVYSYRYAGKKVYYFTPRCCDQPSVLYDESCKRVCRPDGGITGQGDGKCPDFFSTRTDEELVWADPRNVN
jgi:hypothetical protein